MAEPPTYSIKMGNWFGDYWRNIPIGPDTRIDYVQSVNNAGHFTFELPYKETFCVLDNLIQFNRSPGWASPQYLHFLGFLRYWRWERRDDGRIWTVLKGHDPNGLLSRRIVAYPGDNGWSYCDEDPDDEMIQIFQRNFLSDATDVYRDMSKVGGFSRPYAPNIGVKARQRSWTMDDVHLAFQYENAAAVMRKLADIQYNNDTTSDKSRSLFYGIRVSGMEGGGYRRPVLRFEVNYGQWGQDRTSSGYVYSNANGMLINEFFEKDHTKEVNVVYGRGKGIKSLAYVCNAEDPARSRRTPFSRCEKFLNCQSQDTDAQVVSMAESELERNRPVIRAGGQISNTEKARYGTQWQHGDKLRIEVFGQRYDGVIMDTHFSLVDGKEEVYAYVLHEST